MFPNFRLMIAAVAASVVALSCGFGVFAALRVNHEPLARLPPATAPLQLALTRWRLPPAVRAPRRSASRKRRRCARRSGESARHESQTRPPLRPPSRKLSHPLRSEDGDRGAAGRPAGDAPAALPADVIHQRCRAGTGARRCRQRRHTRGLGRSGGCRSGRQSKYREAGRRDREPVPAATPNVAALERPAADTDQTAPADQTQPVERTVSTEQAAPVEQTARLQTAEAEQTARAEQSAPRGQSVPDELIGPTEQTTSPKQVARPNLEDDAADAAPTPTEKIARKKHAKTRVAAKTHRKHHTRVAARANMPDSMFLQPRFVSAPRAFQSPTGMWRVQVTSRRTSSPGSAVGGPFVRTPSR